MTGHATQFRPTARLQGGGRQQRSPGHRPGDRGTGSFSGATGPITGMVATKKGGRHDHLQHLKHGRPDGRPCLDRTDERSRTGRTRPMTTRGGRARRGARA